MKRRQFIRILSGAMATWPIAAPAQQAALPVIGWIHAASFGEWMTTAFRRGLSETGFVEGQSVAVDYRWADGDLDRMLAMVSDLVTRKVSVLTIGGNIVGLRGAVATTRDIPIVFTTAADPVAAGIVASLNRPGGNATGIALLGAEILPKRLELLHQMVPVATKIALLVTQHNPAVLRDDVQNAKAAGLRLGLEIMVVDAGSESEMEREIGAAVARGAGALLVGSDTFFLTERDRLAALGLQHAVPISGPSRVYVDSGCLMSYGFDIEEAFRELGVYTGRILKGERPSDLPVVQPTKFQLAINLKIANTLGIAVPPGLLATADGVIE
jgi:putative tryptophan/tyrosine transport system substrate-binding protein